MSFVDPRGAWMNGQVCSWDGLALKWRDDRQYRRLPFRRHRRSPGPVRPAAGAGRGGWAAGHDPGGGRGAEPVPGRCAEVGRGLLCGAARRCAFCRYAGQDQPQRAPAICAAEGQGEGRDHQLPPR
ncbi:hypothetical protein G6F61_013663 [Rhizopus arrhizus]|nr:hypothetical protein G6F61_013663 [Rhizopus arrhizus]